MILRIKYKIKYYWGSFMQLCGYCRYCGMKVSTTATGRQICTNVRCRD